MPRDNRHMEVIIKMTISRTKGHFQNRLSRSNKKKQWLRRPTYRPFIFAYLLHLVHEHPQRWINRHCCLSNLSAPATHSHCEFFSTLRARYETCNAINLDGAKLLMLAFSRWQYHRHSWTKRSRLYCPTLSANIMLSFGVCNRMRQRKEGRTKRSSSHFDK